jgi:ribonucleoside-diphosphate reductase alpha chain
MSEEVRARKMAEDAGGGNGHGKAGNGHGGNGHSSEETSALAGEPAAESESKAPTEALTDSPPVVPAKLEGLDLGPACSQCGGMMQRTGSCYTCSSCGNNTGCG